MKNTMKRMLSLALALMMCLSVAVPVFAEDATTCPGVDMEHMKANCSYTFVEKHEPTCQSEGYTTYQCNVCGKHFIDDIVKTEKGPHNFETVTPSTCTVNGTEKCTVCDFEREMALAAHDFEYDKEIVGCGKAGEVVTGTCKVCGAKEEIVLEGHAWGNIPTAILVEPRCVPEELADGQAPEDFQGLAQYTCSKCGTTKDVVIYALEHHAMKDVELVTPTCEDGGKEMKDGYAATVKDGKRYGHTCTVCGWQDWEEVEAGHDYQYVEELSVAPTCTKYGYDFYGCTNCGAYETIRHDPLNHKNAYILSNSATCGEEGVIVTLCPDCGETWEEDAEALEHNYQPKTSDATCEEPAKKWNQCENCDDVKDLEKVGEADPSKHQMVDDEENSSDATCMDFGWKASVCEICGYKAGEALSPLGHDYGDEPVEIILPLCGVPGYAVYVCKTCGSQKNEPASAFDLENPLHHGVGRQDPVEVDVYEYTEDEVKAMGMYAGYIAPTCTKPGRVLYRCNTCSNKTPKDNPFEIKFWVAVPATGHVDAAGNPFTGVEYPTECGKSVTVDEDFECAACDFAIKAGTYTTKTTEHNKVGTPVCGETVTFTCNHTIVIVDADGNEVEGVDKVQCTWTETVDVVHNYVETYHHDNLCDGVAHHDGACTQNNDGTWNHVDTCCYSECDGIYYGFTHYVCTICEGEYIDEYEYAAEHDMQEQYTAPTCTETGATYDKCVNVHVNRDGTEVPCDYATDVEIIPATGHIDENGNRINCYTLAEDGKTMIPVKKDVLCYSACCCDNADHKKDEKTGRCTVGHLIEWETLHTWESTYVEGTCIHADYTLWVCTVCKLNGVEDGISFGEHDYTGALTVDSVIPDFSDAEWYLKDGVKIDFDNARWKVLTPATYTESGWMYFNCWKYDGVQCKGCIKAPYTLTDIKLSLDIDSGIVAGADIVNSGKLLVTVQASAYDVDLYSIDLNINYDSTKLVYTGEYIVSDYLKALMGESGVEVGAAIENNIGIYMANSGSVPTNVNMSKMADVDLVTLVFDVKADVNDATSGVSYTELTILDDASVLKADGAEKVAVNLIDDIAEVAIQTLGNVTMGNIESSKKRVDDIDGRELVKVMLTPNAEYLATADINKDGTIDLVDYAALAKYIAAGCTYAELCATGIAD